MKVGEFADKAGNAALTVIVVIVIGIFVCVAFLGGERDEKTGADLA